MNELTILITLILICLVFAYFFYEMGASKSDQRYMDLSYKYFDLLIDNREIRRKLEETHHG